MTDSSLNAKEVNDRKLPLVSIGVPVFNGEKTLGRMLSSLLAQTFTEFEIIISDNASTDKTAAIALDYSGIDYRIRYLRQIENIGPERNFKYVLSEARGRFFMWAAADDFRSPDFLQLNLNFLEHHQDYVASTSPNYFEGQCADDLVRFDLSGPEDERIRKFFQYCWISHGIFYSVIRTDVLRACEYLGRSFLGVDWAINLYLASRGKMHRTSRGLMVSGTNGISNSENAWKRYRESSLGWLFPFHKLSLYTLRMTSHRPLGVRMRLMKILFKLNMQAAYFQFQTEYYGVYSHKMRPWIHKLFWKK